MDKNVELVLDYVIGDYIHMLFDEISINEGKRFIDGIKTIGKVLNVDVKQFDVDGYID